MKKILLLILLFTTSTYSYSQEKFGSYDSGYFEKKYDIEISKPDKDGQYKLYVDCESADKLSKKASMVIKSKDVQDLIRYVKDLKSVYDKWTTTAVENKVLDLTKSTDVKSPDVYGGFLFGSWSFDYNVRLSSRYKIINGKHLMIIDSGELQSSSNQFTKSDGFYIIFNSTSEFDAFMKAIDPVKSEEFVKELSKKEGLFNK